jgi:hypothetical protein
MRLVLSNAAEDAMLESVRLLLEGGELRLFDSVPPSSPAAQPASQTHLATVRFVETRLDAGQVTGSLDPNQLAIASGDATWARAYAADGTPILDCDVGETDSGASIELNTVRVRKGGPIVLNRFTFGAR